MVKACGSTSCRVIVAALSLCLWANSAHGVEKIQQVTADGTQKRYERKAALAAQDLGLQSAAVKVSAQICKKSGKKTKCTPIAGGWTFALGRAMEAAVSKETFDWLVTQRLDKLLIDGTTVGLRTAGSQSDIRVRHVGGFRFGVGEHKAFQDAQARWLAGPIGKLMKQILAQGLQARYAEMSEREQGTFIATRARQQGVPAVFVQKLMNSAYAFFVYLNTPTGSGSIHIGTRKITRQGKVITVPSYSASVTLSTSVVASIHNFSAEKGQFVPYSELTGESGSGVSASRSFDRMPTPAQLLPIFAESLLMSIRATGINLNTQLKYDDNFAIFFTADGVDGSDVDADVGVLEDIRVDAPGVVQREVDGEKVNVGFMKARSVGQNCVARSNTKFALVSGETELGDQVREHPWTGLMLTGSAGMTSYELTSWNGAQATGGGGFVSVLAGLELDLGYAMNTRWLSEIWLELGGGLGFGGEGFSAHNDASPLLIKFDAGLRKRLYLGSSGIYVAPGLDFGLLAMSATDDDVSHSVSSFALTPGVQLGYNISPNLEITAAVGWGLALSQSGSRKVGDGDAQEVDVEASGGLQAGLRLSFHSPVVGPLARLYSKPSTICELNKKAIAGKGAGAEVVGRAPSASQAGTKPAQSATRRPSEAAPSRIVAADATPIVAGPSAAGRQAALRREEAKREEARREEARREEARREEARREEARREEARREEEKAAARARLAATVEAERQASIAAKPVAPTTAESSAPAAPRQTPQQIAEQKRIASLLAESDDIRDARQARRTPTADQTSSMTLRSESEGGGAWKWVLGSLLVGAGGTVAYLGRTAVQEANRGVISGKFAGDYDAYRAEYDGSKSLIWYGAGGTALGGVVLIWAIASSSGSDTAGLPVGWRPVALLDRGGSWLLGGKVSY